MLYNWLTPLSEAFQLFNLLNYITFRTGAAMLTSLLLAFLIGPGLIGFLGHKQGKGQPIREDGPKSHILEKAGTPTMGGLLILVPVITSTILWADLSNLFIWSIFMVMLSFGLIGLYDDYLKVTRQSSAGFSGKIKLLLEFFIAAIFCWMVTVAFAPMPEGFATGLAIPLIKNFTINLGLFFYLFSFLVVVGSANAVNLTDGLDGLAIVPVMIAAMSLAFIGYLSGHIVFSTYLGIPYVAGVGEIAVLLGAIIGGGLGFLWYNAPPAKIFMGDTGSLALGGALGAGAVATKHEIVFAIIGGLFVLEAVSVIVQVGYYKLTGGRRIFLIAPIHHHFEAKGWRQETIVIRFWIIAIILALVGLSTLKLR